MKNTTYNHHKKKQPKANKTYQRKENAQKKKENRDSTEDSGKKTRKATNWLPNAHLDRKTWTKMLNNSKTEKPCKFESGIESSVESGFVSFNHLGKKDNFKQLRKKTKHK